jgi:type III restriction enzyme
VVLKNYQTQAVSELLGKFQELDNSHSPDRICVLRAPTGSGKTRIVADFLPRFVSSQTLQPYAIVWFSVHNLHTQSMGKLREYYEEIGDASLTLSDFSEIENDEIKENQIIFMNWESVVRENNRLRLNSEDTFGLEEVVDNTKRKRALLVIIDESHYHATGPQSQLLLDKLKPTITLEVSATPNLLNRPSALLVAVTDEKVEAEQMIVKSTDDSGRIIINETVKPGQQITAKSGTAQVLDEAIEKRNQLKELYEKEGSKVNPLVLIQLPADSNDRIRQKIDEVKEHLKRQTPEISTDTSPPKLAIWLSGDHSNVEGISDSDNTIDFLIFKQAIAIGWDCPRAAVLVAFRDIKTPEFSIQTLGRILRMPEQKHYENDILNKAYVLTNISNMETAITDEQVKSWVVSNISRRRDKHHNDPRFYDELHLTSRYLERKIKRNEFNNDFIKILKTKLDGEVISDSIIDIERGRLSRSEIDYLDRREFSSGGNMTATTKLGKVETSFAYRELIKKWTRGFVNSTALLNEAIEEIIKEKCNKENSFDIERIVYSNKDLFESNINKSIAEFEKKLEKLNVEIPKKDDDWEVGEVLHSNASYTESPNLGKSVMEPFYLGNFDPNTEIPFIALLNTSDRVKWWHKGRTAKGIDFSILYKDNKDVWKEFFPDFIVYFKDDSVGIYDVKGGPDSDPNQKEKSDALQNCINHHKKSQGRDFKGGLVVNENGRWKIFTGESYSYDLAEWDSLEI